MSGEDPGVSVRPMRHEDVQEAYDVTRAAFPENRDRLEQVPIGTPEEAQRYRDRYRHLVGTDPEGVLVAVEGGRLVGVALAARREGLWFLSLMAVLPEGQGKGVGRALLDRALAYGEEGCRGGMIPASDHPAAIRRYALAGFHPLPTLEASGVVRRAALPAGLRVREGAEADLELVTAVDRAVRGAAHGPDIGALLRMGGRLLVAEDREGRGYAIAYQGAPWLLAADDPTVASELLWACLAGAGSNSRVDVRWLTASQGWAVPVVLAAGLSLTPFGPLCVRGGSLGPLHPYLPSMLYL